MLYKNSLPIAVLSYGANITNPEITSGTQLLSYDKSCTLGCESKVNGRILTDYCVTNVKKDVKEFTDIQFTFEVSTTIPSDQLFIAEIYNLDTGKTLFRTSDTEEYVMGQSYVNSFAINKEVRLGVRFKNTAKIDYKYQLKSEYGETIINKTYENSMHTFDTITVRPVIYGCTDTTAANYNSRAAIDDGTCFDAGVEQCVKNSLFSLSLTDCDTKEAERALKIYALYDGYKQAVIEGNQTKIDMYIQKLTDMCNAEYCESC